MRLAEYTCDEVAALRWTWDGRSPVLGPPLPSPVLADPTFLLPDRTPDGQWHLWAHSLLGIHHHTSGDGINWHRRETVQRNALRAQVVDLGADTTPRYRLLYERTRMFLPFGVRWRSWIESRSSDDLRHWSPPVVLLRPSLPWHSDPKLGEALSNPCLVAVPGSGWRLYVSAGLVHVPDCGFNEPAYVGVAHGAGPDGLFTIRREPLGMATPDAPGRNRRVASPPSSSNPAWGCTWERPREGASPMCPRQDSKVSHCAIRACSEGPESLTGKWNLAAMNGTGRR